MDLPEVRLARITTDARPVLHRAAVGSVVLHAEPGKQTDAVLIVLAEPVLDRPAYRDDQGAAQGSAYSPKMERTVESDSTSLSTSARVLCTANDAREVAGTPRRRISG